jgi:hypothetical protein
VRLFLILTEIAEETTTTGIRDFSGALYGPVAGEHYRQLRVRVASLGGT